MHRIVYQEGNYIVKKIRKGHYVYNKNRQHGEHTHIYRLKDCIDLIDCINKEKVPTDDYLKESLLRICPGKKRKLIAAVEHKIAKDRDKQRFHDVRR